MLTITELLSSYINLYAFKNWLLLGSLLYLLFSYLSYYNNDYILKVKNLIYLFIFVFGLVTLIWYLGFYKVDDSSKYINQTISMLEDGLKEAKASKANLQEHKEFYQQKLSLMNNLLDELTKKHQLNQEQQAKINAIIKDLDDLEADLEQEAVVVNNDIQDKKKKHHALGKELVKKDEEIKQNEAEIKRTKNDIIREQLKTKLTEIKSQRNKIFNEMTQLEIEIGKLEVKYNSLQEIIRNTNILKEHFEKQRDQLVSRDQQILDKITTVEEKRQQIQKRIDEINARIDEEKAYEDAITQQIADLNVARSAWDTYDQQTKFTSDKLFGFLGNTTDKAANLFIGAQMGKSVGAGIGAAAAQIATNPSSMKSLMPTPSMPLTTQQIQNQAMNPNNNNNNNQIKQQMISESTFKMLKEQMEKDLDYRRARRKQFDEELKAEQQRMNDEVNLQKEVENIEEAQRNRHTKRRQGLHQRNSEILELENNICIIKEKIKETNIKNNKQRQHHQLLKADQLLKEEKKSIKQTLKNVNAYDLEVEYKRNKFEVIRNRNNNINQNVTV